MRSWKKSKMAARKKSKCICIHITIDLTAGINSHRHLILSYVTYNMNTDIMCNI